MPRTYRELTEDLFRAIREEALVDHVSRERKRKRSWRQIAEDLAKLTDGRVDPTHAWLYETYKDEIDADAGAAA